jgi:phosphohistidine phosphatase SixA
MRISLLSLVLSIVLITTSCSQTIYVVRHGEKALPEGTSTMMKNDPPLSDAGKERAEALKEVLKTEKIGYIFSTNTIRTQATAEPTRAYFNLSIETYSPAPDSLFIHRLKTIKKNTLVVGHSNTVDDIVNKLCGATKIPGDLQDTEYDNLFVLKKKGKKITFENRKYGKASL